MNNLPCSCTPSSFTDPNHGHIVTGDLRIVQNNTLRKLLCKGPKYREPVSINIWNCKTEIKHSLTTFSFDWCKVMCPIDKVANSIAFMCKKYYVQVFLKESGLINTTSNTYEEVNELMKKWMILFVIFFKNKILHLILFSAYKIMTMSLIVFHVFIGSQKCLKYHLMQDL